MDPVRWERIEQIFELVAPLSARERAAVITRACGGDPALRAEVEAMVAVAAPEHALAVEQFVQEGGAVGGTPDPVVGTVLGNWRVAGVLGRGGMGTVYLAERADGQYQQQAALKLVLAGSWRPDSAERFRTERQVLARLSHPNIARLLDGGLAGDGRPYFVMELVDGAPITEWCARRRPPVAELLRLFRVVCDAVQHAHGALVVHRDLKPANTFVTSAGQVKLLDFGIAKLLEPGAAETRDLATRMTPEYAAPEQFFGGAITTATDVYSLGVLLYELLTGVRPFQLEGAMTPGEVERQFLTATIAPPSKRLGRRRGDDLDCIVLKALRADPQRRYVSAGQLGEDVGRFLEGRPVLARPDSVGYRTRHFILRNRAMVAGAVVFAASLLGFGIVATWQARRAAGERDVARLERVKAEKVIEVLVDLFETTNPNIRPDGDRMSVRQFLAQAEPRVIEQLQKEPSVRARLRQVFGLIHAARDQYPEARKALEQALAEQRRLLGPDHPEVIESLYQLGLLAQHTENHDERARALLEEALARCLRVHGENHEKTAQILTALAHPARLEHRLEEGGSLLRRAFDIRARLLPPNRPELAETMGQLAHYHSARGEKTEARRLYARALALWPPEERRHPRAIQLLNDYAALLVEMHDHAAAEAMLRESLELARTVFGAVSFPVAEALDGLATELDSQGRHAEGEQLFRETHGLHLSLLGEDHWRTVTVVRDLGWTLALQQRYPEALAWMDRGIASRKRTSSSPCVMRYQLEGKRAVILLRLGRGEEAVKALASTLAELRAANIPGSDYVVIDLQLGTALALIETGRAAQAATVARDALAAATSYMGKGPMRAAAECLLGWALALTGRRAEARERLSLCLPVYRKWGRADPRTLAALDQLWVMEEPAAPARAQ